MTNATDATPANAELLCALDELPENGSLRVTFAGDSHQHGICLVRVDTRIRGYLNRCPHQDMAMDWLPGQFLDHDHRTIVCSMHGARFDPGDGLCVSGPCRGQRLTAVPLIITDTQILLDRDHPAAPERDD